MLLKRLSALILPGGLFFLGAAAFLQWIASPESLTAISRVLPYAALILGIALGWRFHRSWLIFAALAIALSDRALVHFAPRAPEIAGGPHLLFHGLALLLPLNLLSLSWVAKRGARASAEGWLLGLLAFQSLLLAVLFHLPDALPGPEGPSSAGPSPFPWTPLAPTGLMAFALVFLFFTLRFAFHPAAIEAGFFWSLISLFLGMNAGQIGNLSTFYFSLSSLLLSLSLIETSYRMAYQDELTGLPARRALEEALSQVGNHYAVAMVDVDEFKKVNDTYGHDVGDQVLRMVAARIEEASGEGHSFRYGGEEFTLIYPGRSTKEVLPQLEALRKAIASSEFILRGSDRPRKKPKTPPARKGTRKGISVTASIGVSERNAGHLQPAQVIRAADQALYRAKREGRNRICI